MRKASRSGQDGGGIEICAADELGIPFCTQVGHTGPLMPSETDHPVPYLDEVALTFPELKIVAGHIGDGQRDHAGGMASGVC